MDVQNESGTFPETLPATPGAGSVPDTKPSSSRASAPTPDTKPSKKSDSAPTPDTKAVTPTRRPDVRHKPDVLAAPPRNARPYNGQKLGLKHDNGVDIIPEELLNLALVGLDTVDGVLTPGGGTRVLDHAPWTGWPIVELN